MKPETSDLVDILKESLSAKEYWKSPAVHPSTYGLTPHYVAVIAQIIDSIKASTIFEFGCGSGRNLAKLKELLSNNLDVYGIDINQELIRVGRKKYNLLIKEGDETSLKRIKDSSFDLVFTVSVLGHIPDIKEIIKNLARITNRYCLFIEPSTKKAGTQTVKLEKVFYLNADDPAITQPAPYTYLHNYSELFKNHNLKVRMKCPLPTHYGRSGLLYKLWLLEKESNQLPKIKRQEPLSTIKLKDKIIFASISQLLLNSFYKNLELKEPQSLVDDPKSTLQENEFDYMLPKCSFEHLIGYWIDNNKKAYKIAELERITRSDVEAKYLLLKNQTIEHSNNLKKSESQLKKCKEEVVNLNKQLTLLENQKITLEKKTQEIANTLSFRLGRTFKFLDSIGSMPKMPLPAYLKSKMFIVSSFLSISSLLRKNYSTKLIQTYEKGGIAAADILLQKISYDKKERARYYTELAKHCKSKSLSNAVELAKRAYQEDPRDFRAKWLAFQLFEVGIVSEANELLEKVASKVEFSRSETVRFEEIKAIAKFLHEKPRIEMAPATIYTPEPNSLLYVAANAFPYHVNGYARRTQSILESFVKVGIKLTAMTRPGYPWDRKNVLKMPKRNNTWIEGIQYLHSPAPSQGLPLSIYWQQAELRIMEVAKKNKISAIHAASNYVNALPALLAAKRLGIPFYYEMRGLWDWSRASKTPGYENTERFKFAMDMESYIVQHADHVYVISQELRSYIVQEWGIKGSMSILPNCIDPQKFQMVSSESGQTNIGYVGSLVPYEGLDVLIEAISILRNRNIFVNMKIFGNGEALTALEEQVSRLGLKDRIAFLGSCPPEEALNILSTFDVICLPRKKHKVCELIPPIKLVEAMGLGKPVIVPDLPVFREEVQNGKTGYFFKPEDPVDLARVIEGCLSSLNNAHQIGNVARASVLQNRTWDIYAQKVAERLKNKYLSVFSSSGVDGVIAKITIQYKNDTKNCIRALHQVGKLLAESGYPEANYTLALEALKITRSEPNLRTALWASMSAKKYFQAAQFIDEIIDYYEKNPAIAIANSNYVLKINQIKNADINIFRSLALIKKATIKAKISPIPGRVSYILHNSLPYSSGGYAIRSHGIATGLSSEGFNVKAITRLGYPINLKGSELREEDVPRVDIIDGVRYSRLFEARTPFLAGFGYTFRMADELERILRKQKPSIVIAASAYPSSLPALIAARRIGVPFIYEVRGFWEITKLSRDSSYKETNSYRRDVMFETEVAKEADLVFTLTEAMREELAARGIPKNKIELLPNACDPLLFSPLIRDEKLAAKLNIPSNVPVIGYIGTFVDYEGLEDLVEACVLLKSRGVAFRLLLIGNENVSVNEGGLITAEIIRIAQKQNLKEWLIMPGRVPHDEVRSYYSLIDIVPIPRKPWLVCEMVSPIKPLEALAMEKAVVVSSVGALAEMIEDGKTGLVFEKGNINSLADTLERLISDSDLRTKLGAAGRQWVLAERTWQIVTFRMKEKILEVISGKN